MAEISSELIYEVLKPFSEMWPRDRSTMLKSE